MSCISSLRSFEVGFEIYFRLQAHGNLIYAMVPISGLFDDCSRCDSENTQDVVKGFKRQVRGGAIANKISHDKERKSYGSGGAEVDSSSRAMVQVELDGRNLQIRKRA